MFDACLIGIRQLRSIRAEYFDAVVLIRIMRSRNHHATRIAQPLRQQRDCRRRNDAGVLHLRGCVGESSLKMVKDPWARDARVLPDQYFASEFLSDGLAY